MYMYIYIYSKHLIMSILSDIVIYPCVVYAYLYIFIYTQETQFACPRAKLGIWHA